MGTLFSLVVIMFIGTIRAGLELKHRLSDWFKFVKKTGQSLMNDQRLLLCLLFCVCVFTWFEASLIYRPFFNVHDDYGSYLVSIQRLLQLGWFGKDPFNLRMLVSAVGGHSFMMAYAFCSGRRGSFIPL